MKNLKKTIETDTVLRSEIYEMGKAENIYFCAYIYLPFSHKLYEMSLDELNEKYNFDLPNGQLSFAAKDLEDGTWCIGFDTNLIARKYQYTLEEVQVILKNLDKELHKIQAEYIAEIRVSKIDTYIEEIRVYSVCLNSDEWVERLGFYKTLEEAEDVITALDFDDFANKEDKSNTATIETWQLDQQKVFSTFNIIQIDNSKWGFSFETSFSDLEDEIFRDEENIKFYFDTYCETIEEKVIGSIDDETDAMMKDVREKLNIDDITGEEEYMVNVDGEELKLKIIIDNNYFSWGFESDADYTIFVVISNTNYKINRGGLKDDDKGVLFYFNNHSTVEEIINEVKMSKDWFERGQTL